MGYQYDIFISYTRSDKTLRWITRHFEPLLKDCVQEELLKEPTIFLDKSNVEAGVSWPHKLGVSLGNSRILIPLLSKSYLHSEWCCHELSVMLCREQQSGKRSAEDSWGLIIPVIVYECELPPPLSCAQFLDLKQYFNSRMPTYGDKPAEMESILLHEASAIANAIRSAPAWCSAWPLQAANEFYDILRYKTQSQQSLPRFTQ